MPKRSTKDITKSRVDALAPGKTLWDASTIGFGVTANKHSKSYKLKYRFEGAQRMLTIGVHGSPWTVDSARKQALAYLTELHSGSDPAVTKQSVSVTVAALCDEYMQKHAHVEKKASSAHQDQINIKNHIRPLLGKLVIADVTPKNLDDFKIKVQTGKTAPTDPKAVQKAQRGGSPVKGGPGVANRCMALLSKMFNLAELWGYRPQNTNPTRGISKFKETAKERYLSDEELQRLWGQLDEMGDSGIIDPFAIAFFRLLILTGARKSEIQFLTWSMVDFKAKRLQLTDSKTGRKSIQLSDHAVEVLEDLGRVQGNPYVIVGAKEKKPLQNVRKPWIAIRKAAGLNDVRIHDLRHSFASFAAAEGVPLVMIGKLLGHKNVGTTARYAHLSERFAWDSNNTVGKRLKGVIAGDTLDKDSDEGKLDLPDDEPRSQVFDTLREI